MPNTVSAVEQVRLKVKRADQHIKRIQEVWTSFTGIIPHPYTVAFKDDPQTQKRSYYMAGLRDMPLFPMSLLIGDAIQNLRTALDHLIHQAIFKETGIWPSNTRICFPIGKNPTEYPAPEFGGRVKGLGNAGIKILDSLRAYKTGNESFWRLHSLNNKDKHRLLIPAVTGLSRHSITPSIRTKLLKSYLGSYPGSSVMPDLWRVRVTPENTEFPLKQGSILLTIPQAELEDNMSFTFDIAFNEPDIPIVGEPVIDALRRIRWNVSATIDRFERAGLI